jgi:hypothetical protein
MCDVCIVLRVCIVCIVCTMVNMRTLVNMVNKFLGWPEPPVRSAGRVSWPSVMARARPRARVAHRRLGLTQRKRGCGRRLPVETGVSTVRRPTPFGGRLLPFLNRVLNSSHTGPRIHYQPPTERDGKNFFLFLLDRRGSSRTLSQSFGLHFPEVVDPMQGAVATASRKGTRRFEPSLHGTQQ